MARYEVQCSQIGSFSLAKNFKLYVDMWQDSSKGDIDIANNKSRVRYSAYCQSSGSGSLDATHWRFFSIEGKEIFNTTEKIKVNAPNANIPIAEGVTDWIQHNSDGSKLIWFSAQIKANSYGVEAGIVEDFTLVQIPRYTTVWQSERGKTINTISINWTTADARDWTQYSLNGGAWQDAYDTVAADNKNGYYTISNLLANTQYTIKTRCRRADSQMWSESESLTIKTQDYAKISSAPNFNLGDDVTIKYSNPSGAKTEIGIFSIDGNVAYAAYRNCSGNSYKFTFTDAELDSIYKELGTNNFKEFKVFVRTTEVGMYFENKSIIITLTGNQKTVRTNVGSKWNRGKLWININGIWKRGVSWQNANGTWKRGG
jgi:hypothetical protein